MKKKKDSDQSWNDIARSLKQRSADELLKLVRDLYELNDQNRRFVSSRFTTKRDLENYKEIIRRGVYPDAMRNQRFDLRAARAAITDYKTQLMIRSVFWS